MSDHKTKVKVINALAKNGRCTADDLLAEAKSKAHPLHKDFEWDDKIAGPAYRLGQAREIIRSVRVTIVRGDKRMTSVAYVRDPDCGPKEQGYVSVAQLRTEEDAAQSALTHEVDRIIMAYERARELAAMLELEGDLEIALQAAMTLKARTRRGPSKRQEEESRVGI